MAHTSTGGTVVHDDMLTGGDPQAHEFINGTVVSEGSDSSHDSEEEVLKLEMKLSWTDRRILDLMHTIQQEELTKRALAEQLGKYEENDAKKTLALTKVERLRSKNDALTKAMQEKDSRLEAVLRDATSAGSVMRQSRSEMATLRARKDRLCDQVGALDSELSAAKTEVANAACDRTLVHDLAAKNAVLQDKTEELAEKYEQVNAMHSYSKETINNMTGTTTFLRNKNKNTESEIKDLREKLTAAEKARDWYVCDLQIRKSPNAP